MAGESRRTPPVLLRLLGAGLLFAPTLGAAGCQETSENQAGGVPNSEPAIRLTCQLEVDPDAAGFPARLVVRNRSSEEIQLLRENLPVDGVPDKSLFVVARDGRRVPYLGRTIKRPAPGAGDYEVVAPGQELRREVNLAPAYDLNPPGRYSIYYLTLHPTPGTGEMITVRSNTIEFERR